MLVVNLHILKKSLQLPLKPYQRVVLIAQYLVPKFLCVLVEGTPSPSYLKALDNDLRQIFKQNLHLPAGRSAGFMYTPKRDSGLGLLRLSSLVPLAYLKVGVKLLSTDDPLVREITVSDHFV
jgi:hypothetical protein